MWRVQLLYKRVAYTCVCLQAIEQRNVSEEMVVCEDSTGWGFVSDALSVDVKRTPGSCVRCVGARCHWSAAVVFGLWAARAFLGGMRRRHISLIGFILRLAVKIDCYRSSVYKCEDCRGDC